MLNLTLANSTKVDFENFYKGRACFLVVNGPSLRNFDLGKLKDRGIVTFSVNNGWTHFKPNLWTCVDDPGNFHDVGWKDPSIMKFVPEGKRNKCIHEKDPETGEFKISQLRVADMPSVIFYPVNTNFQLGTFLYEGSVNYGMNGKKVDEFGIKGKRSVMLAVMRLMYYLGFRRVYIVGADFKMDPARPYAFEQDKNPGGIDHNNNAYRAMNVRFKALRPVFEKNGFHVYNVTPNSGLKAFDYKDFDEAVEEAAGLLQQPIDSKGWYGNLKGQAQPAVWKGRQRRTVKIRRTPTGKGKRR